MQSLELSPGQVIEVLNPILRGWGQYYSQVSSTEAFAKVDYVVWLAYLYWLKKKYPRTAVKKLMRIHFEKVGNSLIPIGTIVKNGKTSKVSLFRLTSSKAKTRKRTNTTFNKLFSKN
jgi:RNA-directed DNA polymerase